MPESVIPSDYRLEACGEVEGWKLLGAPGSAGVTEDGFPTDEREWIATFFDLGSLDRFLAAAREANDSVCRDYVPGPPPTTDAEATEWPPCRRCGLARREHGALRAPVVGEAVEWGGSWQYRLITAAKCCGKVIHHPDTCERARITELLEQAGLDHKESPDA